MNPKRKYYEIFGLTENASKPEVRRAYRKLAMRFHPDKNPDPKAHEVFMQLTQAYEILMDDSYVFAAHKQPVPRKEQSEEERIREAKRRLNSQKYRQHLEQEYYFRKLTTGVRWKIFRIFARISAVIACILLLEPILPSHFENHTVVAYSNTYNGLQYNNVRCLKTDRGIKIFVENPPASMFMSDPRIVVERSLILRNPEYVWYQALYSQKRYPVDFSVTNLYPLIPLIFGVPAFVAWYKRKSLYFSMGYLFSQYIVGACLIILLVTQDRWLHLLSLGFL